MRGSPDKLSLDAPEVVPTRYWHELDDGRVQCDLCPRECRLRDGQRGMCFVRANVAGRVVLTTYGRASGFCIDPVEKKPLYHFLPGTIVLSFGTAGCNLACKFCQNWDISKSRATETTMESGEPERIAVCAKRSGCRSVAFTYNEPAIFHEYAIDVAAACRALGIRSIAVTAGYVSPRPRAEFYRHMDAVNVDLKSFREEFYQRLTGGHLAAVLETIEYLHRETDVWLELTTLLIPGLNDGDDELRALTRWIADRLGRDVPLHFTAFHPDYKLMNRPPTALSTLQRARRIALDAGIHHTYIGNAHDRAADSTYCPSCGAMLIERDWYDLTAWNLDAAGRCRRCGARCAGVFEGGPGDWGPRRLPVRV